MINPVSSASTYIAGVVADFALKVLPALLGAAYIYIYKYINLVEVLDFAENLVEEL